MKRRDFLHLAAGTAIVALPRIALADTYPSRPVRVIVGLPPANSPDIIARLISGWLSERLGQPFFVENRPGAATGIATEARGARGAGRLHAAPRRRRQYRQRLGVQESQL